MAVTVRGADILFADGTSQSTAATSFSVSAGGNFQNTGSLGVGGTNNNGTNTLQSPRLYVSVSGSVRIKYIKTENYTANPYGGTAAQARGYIYKNGSAVSGLISVNGTLDVACAPGDYFQTSVYNVGSQNESAGLYITGVGVSTFPRSPVAIAYTF